MTRPDCINCIYPDCFAATAQIDTGFEKSDASTTPGEPPEYDPELIKSACSLYEACRNYRDAVDFASDIESSF